MIFHRVPEAAFAIHLHYDLCRQQEAGLGPLGLCSLGPGPAGAPLRQEWLPEGWGVPLESPSWGLEGEVVGPKTLADPTGSRELGRSRLCREAPLTRSLTLLPDVPKLRHSGRRFAACVLAASKCVCMRAAGPRDPSAAVRWGGPLRERALFLEQRLPEAGVALTSPGALADSQSAACPQSPDP